MRTTATRPRALAALAISSALIIVAIAGLVLRRSGGDPHASLRVHTLAGSGAYGFGNGRARAATFATPYGVATDRDGNIYVADAENDAIRRVTPDGHVTTFAGSGAAGFNDGPGSEASFDGPLGVAVAHDGSVIVADTGNHAIRRIAPTGVVSTLAGSGKAGYADGRGTAARFDRPQGVAVDQAGRIVVADADNHRIRLVTATGDVATFAGAGTAGFTDGSAAAAEFDSPSAVTVDPVGNVFVADSHNHAIREITTRGVVLTIAGSGRSAYADGSGRLASFSYPAGLAFGPDGALYVSDSDNHRIRRIASNGVVSTVAGVGTVGDHDAVALRASFDTPTGIAFTANGLAVVVDENNNLLRELDGVVPLPVVPSSAPTTTGAVPSLVPGSDPPPEATEAESTDAPETTASTDASEATGPADTSSPTTAATGPVVLHDGAVVAAGSSFEVSGDGVAPKTSVEIELHSEPVPLGTADADDDGHYVFVGKLPEGVTGAHTVVATGRAADGHLVHIDTAITITREADAAPTDTAATLAITGPDELALTSNHRDSGARRATAATGAFIFVASLLLGVAGVLLRRRADRA